MRICPNDKYFEIFAQRFHYFEDPFYKFFALDLLFQDTSYSLALNYSSFSVLRFKILISGSKSVKFGIFLKFLILKGTLPVMPCASCRLGRLVGTVRLGLAGTDPVLMPCPGISIGRS